MLAALAAAAVAVSIQSPAPVQALAADGYRVAYAAGFSARDCNRVYVWNLRTRAVVKLGRRTHCERTSTGNAIRSLALAGTRALWLQYQGGNRREYSLWTATTARPRPTLLRSVEVDVDDPAPFVIGEGDASRYGEILPYAAGATVYALRANGSRAFSWRAPARVTSLAATEGELAVGAVDGSVTVLDSGGRVLRQAAGNPVLAVVVTGSALLVQRGNTVDNLASGETYALPRGARLHDGYGDAGVFERAGVIYRLDLLRSGAVSVIGRGTLAQLEPKRTITVAGRTITAR